MELLENLHWFCLQTKTNRALFLGQSPILTPTLSELEILTMTQWKLLKPKWTHEFLLAAKGLITKSDINLKMKGTVFFTLTSLDIGDKRPLPIFEIALKN